MRSASCSSAMSSKHCVRYCCCSCPATSCRSSHDSLPRLPFPPLALIPPLLRFGMVILG